MAQLEELERLVRTHRNGRVAILELWRGLRNGVIKHMLAQIANACEHPPSCSTPAGHGARRFVRDNFR